MKMKPKGWTQGRKPQMFSMPPNAAAWLKWGWDGKGDLCRNITPTPLQMLSAE